MKTHIHTHLNLNGNHLHRPHDIFWSRDLVVAVVEVGVEWSGGEVEGWKVELSDRACNAHLSLTLIDTSDAEFR